MRVLLQRVTRARVRVGTKEIAGIDRGVVLFVGCGNEDGADEPSRLAEKVAHLRVFDDPSGRPDLTLDQVDGAALVVPQFTLYGSVRKGRRPSWDAAAPPEEARARVEAFAQGLEERGVRVQRGAFREHMEVELTNDGPFTLWIEGAALSR